MDTGKQKERIEKPEAEKKPEAPAAPGLEIGPSEAADVISGVEAPSEKVREKVGEKKGEGVGPGTAVGVGQAQDLSALIAKLEASAPSKEVMIREVRGALHKKVKNLIKDAKSAKSKGDLHGYSESIAKVREHRSILRTLAKMTYESLRNMWIRLVHNIG